MIKNFRLSVLVALGFSASFSSFSKGKVEGFYCTGTAWRVYLKPTELKDSTGEKVGVAGTSLGSRIWILPNSHETVEECLSYKQHASKGDYIALTPSQDESDAGTKVSRATGYINFDGGYSVRIQILDVDNALVGFTNFNAALVKVDSNKITRVFGKQNDSYSEGDVHGQIVNIDVDNFELANGDSNHEDQDKNFLSKLIEKGDLPDGSITGVTYSCTPKLAPADGAVKAK